MSRKTSTTRTLPSIREDGAALSRCQILCRLWIAKACGRPDHYLPSRKTFLTGFSTGRGSPYSRCRTPDPWTCRWLLHDSTRWGLSDEFMTSRRRSCPWRSPRHNAGECGREPFSLFDRASCAFLRSDSSRCRSPKHNTAAKCSVGLPVRMVRTDLARSRSCIAWNPQEILLFVCHFRKGWRRIWSHRLFSGTLQDHPVCAARPLFLRRSIVCWSSANFLPTSGSRI